MTFAEYIHSILYRGLEHLGKFYSSYRGYVVDNEDPDNLGRIKVKIPVVTRNNTHTKWAYPKNNFSGKNYGTQFLPMVGDIVWIEFEYGNTEFPIWSHGHFSKGEKPEEFVSSEVYGFKSPKGQLIIIDDRDDQVYVKLEKADGELKEYMTEVIAFNHGTNGGLVNVIELTKELHLIQRKINDILKHYDSHVHIDPLSGYTGPPSPPMAGSDSVTPRPDELDLTEQDYIEDEKVLH